jgi:hypothetical protein
MRFLVRLVPSNPSRDPFLATVRGLARSVGAEARNPKWTSYGALELDVFCPNRGDFDLFVSIVRPMADIEFTRDLNVAPPHRPEQELFLEAREYFNAERYWECHEVLEGIWRLKRGEEKWYLQGLILLCAAFIHHQKGEEKVALGVLRRAAKQLDYPESSYGGFDVRGVKVLVDKMLQTGEIAVFQV